MKTFRNIIFALLILFILSVSVWLFIFKGDMPAIQTEEIPDCRQSLDEYIAELNQSSYPYANTENGEKLRKIYKEAFDAQLLVYMQEKKSAEATVMITCVDEENLYNSIAETMQAKLSTFVREAKLPSEVYDENNNFRAELFNIAFEEALNTVVISEKSENYELKMQYETTNGWNVENNEEIEGNISTNIDEKAEEIIKFSTSTMPVVEFKYSIEKGATSGPKPKQENFGATSDVSEVKALLNDPRAKKLIGDDALAWNEDIPLLEDSVIRYYLDDTILMLQWQENTDGCCGTYSEVFIADASQLRRKIAGDSYGNMEFNYASVFAQSTNSIIAYGGDLYNHARACGIMVYNGDICRFEPNTCDTLYFDRDGNMIYSRRGEFTDEAEARALIEENGVDFSICFGPVLINNGEDVTPEMYNWGEINDTYARSAIGQLGKLHYFTGNLNCFYNTPHTLATLQQMTNAMLSHGCYTAYALDGGQTAETIVNGQMVNPVQFAREREVSDIIYFCTAIPEE